MKIALLNDTHFGVRNDSSFFLDHFLDFFENEFFPYLKNNGISTVFHLGDLMDRRKYVNINTLNQVKERFIDPLKDMKINFHMVIGNHDIYYRNTTSINSANELFSNYSNFYLHETPYTFEHDELCIGLIPWLCGENREECLDYIKNCNCPIIMGHFELSGHEVFPGVSFKDGLSDKIFSRFESVLSGHFHIRSSKNNIQYLGSQYQMTFADVETKKGFSVLDTETREVEFIENKNDIFHVISTNNVGDDFDYGILEDKYVKLLVDRKTSREKTDSILNSIEHIHPYDLTVIEEFVTSEPIQENVDLSKDTITIINDEIELLEDGFDKSKLKNIMSDIYMEALNS